MSDAATRLTGSPERIFVSVDESTGRSTISFAPAGVGDPIPRENDPAGAQALAEARTIAQAHPGCAIVGPHFHAAPTRARRPRGPR